MLAVETEKLRQSVVADRIEVLEKNRKKLLKHFTKNEEQKARA